MKEPDLDPDPWGSKTYGSYGSGTLLSVHAPDGIPGYGEDEEGEGTPERQQGAPEESLHRHTVQAFMLKGQ
jgi:hypothetical protein